MGADLLKLYPDPKLVSRNIPVPDPEGKMRRLRKVLCVFLIAISFAAPDLVAQTKIRLGARSDSADITFNAALVARVLWSGDAGIDNGDSIEVSYEPVSRILLDEGYRKIISNTPAVRISPINASAQPLRPYRFRVRFYQNLSAYADEALQSLGLRGFRLTGQNFPGKELGEVTFLSNPSAVEFHADSILAESKFVAAFNNVVSGGIRVDLPPEHFGESFYVHPRDTASFYPGVTFDSATIFAHGSVKAFGLPADSIRIFRIHLNDLDSTSATLRGDFEFARVNLLESHNASVSVKNSHIGSIVSMRSRSELSHSSIFGVHSHNSKMKISNSVLNLSEKLDISNSIFSLTASDLTQPQTGGCIYQGSAIILKSNRIDAPATEGIGCMGRRNTLFLVDSNTFFSPKGTWGTIGLELEQSSFAIVRNNLFKGFNYGILIQDSSKATIHNNTFTDFGERGIATKGLGSRVAIYNNIFRQPHRQDVCAISLTHFFVNYGLQVWLGKNVYHFPKQDLYPCFLTSIDSAKVFGDKVGIKADPQFNDTNTYELRAGSPAIDNGERSVRTFPFEYRLLDSSISVSDTSMVLSGYLGAGPDIGAWEFPGSAPSGLKQGIPKQRLKSVRISGGKVIIRLDDFLHARQATIDVCNVHGSKKTISQRFGPEGRLEFDKSHLFAGLNTVLIKTPAYSQALRILNIE